MNKPFPSEAEHRRGEPDGPVEGGGRLRLRCLGSLRLEDQSGNDITPRTRKARAVLAYLAVLERPVSRAKLADLLWSARAGEQSRASVRQALFELRHLSDGSELVASPGRDDVALNGDMLSTDLSLIRIAAQAGDWDRLQELLAASDPGLLTDLDGLDPEFDAWLQVERVDEPARTLAMALAAAERCLAEEGPRAAQGIVAEVQRLDPSCEEAARLALRIDHEIGDSAALHRHFALFRDRLREEYGAEPSDETRELFQRLTSTAASPRRASATHGDSSGASVPAPAALWEKPGRWRLVALALALFVLLGAAWWQLRSPARQAELPALIAVLPFEQHPNDDGFLAMGLWEHTRAALTRNRSLRVLGRATTAAAAGENLLPENYRKRFGVTHLLEGAVRRSGNQLLVSVSLARTSDGAAIWQGMFRGQIGEPFSLQNAIATVIEGKLRARLAPQGGRLAEQIATTPEVYGLYSEARELMISRQRDNIRRAEALLRRAVKLDPNFAPAWSLLGSAIQFRSRNAITDSAAQSEALAAVRRALAMAPNLAQGHATLAMLEGGSSPAAERALRKAIALDPNYSEAWMWLGNALHSQHRLDEAAVAYERAVDIDPLFQPAVQNLARTAAEMHDGAAADRLLRRITAAGASPMLIAAVRSDQLNIKGDYSGAAKILLEHGLDARKRPPTTLRYNWFQTLTALGHYETLRTVNEAPDWYAPLLRGEVLPPRTFEGRTVSPEEFWTSLFFSGPASRAMVNLGRSDELVRLYRRGFQDADEFILQIGRQGMLAELAPTLAIALDQEGAREEASYLLSAASKHVEPGVRRSPNRFARAQLAAIRAAQGERAQAVALLEAALRQGWLPDGRERPLDLADEPAFRSLRGDRRFERARGRILAHIARERAELGPLKL